MNEIWVVDDNRDTQTQIVDGLRKRLSATPSLTADNWVVVGAFKDPSLAWRRFETLSAENRSKPTVVVFDLYSPTLIPDGAAKDPFEGAIFVAIDFIAKFVAAGVKTLVCTFVLKYCESHNLSALAEQVRVALRRIGVDVSTQLVEKSDLDLLKGDIDAIWIALEPILVSSRTAGGH